MSKGVLILVLVSVVWSVVSAILQRTQEKRAAAAGPDAGEAPEVPPGEDRASALRNRRSTQPTPPPPTPEPPARNRPVSEHSWEHLSGKSHSTTEPATASRRSRQSADVRAMLRSPRSLRSSIIVAEILGKPKGV
jgi:hypothetical protein